jgi:hypothetical protein
MTAEPKESKSLEERVALLETKLKEIENQLSGPATPQQPTPTIEALDISTANATVKAQSPKISVTLVSKSFHQMNIIAGDVGPRIDFTLVFHSHFEKDLRAFKGAMVIKDLFDEDIMRVALTHEAGVPANGTAEWNGGISSISSCHNINDCSQLIRTT